MTHLNPMLSRQAFTQKKRLDRLLFQDADGRMVHVLTLGSDEVRSWLEALRSWE